MKLVILFAALVLVAEPSEQARAQGASATAVDSVNTRVRAKMKKKPVASPLSATVPASLAGAMAARSAGADSAQNAGSTRQAPPAPKRSAPAQPKKPGG